MCLPSTLTSLVLSPWRRTGLYDWLMPTVKLGTLSNLRELELYEYGSREALHQQQSPWQQMVEHLGMLTRLGIAVPDVGTAQESSVFLRPLTQLQSLRSLMLLCRETYLPEELQLHSVTKLRILGHPASVAQVPHMFPSLHCCSLHVLAHRGVAALSACSHLTNLSATADDALLAALTKPGAFKHLQVLEASCRDAVGLMRGVMRLPALIELGLRCVTGLDDHTLDLLLRARQPCIRRLHLQKCSDNVGHGHAMGDETLTWLLRLHPSTDISISEGLLRE